MNLVNESTPLDQSEFSSTVIGELALALDPKAIQDKGWNVNHYNSSSETVMEEKHFSLDLVHTDVCFYPTAIAGSRNMDFPLSMSIQACLFPENPRGPRLDRRFLLILKTLSGAMDWNRTSSTLNVM